MESLVPAYGWVHTLQYDADGLRRSWQHWAVGWGAPVITNTAWDNQNMLSGEANFVQSPGLYGENLIYDPGGTEQGFYHFDGMGSVTELTDSTGTVTDVHRYAAFGEPIYDVNSSAADRPHFRYAGKLGYYRHVDAGLGNLDYLRARWYNRDVRRFISRDPIFNPGSPYPYAIGNPGSWVDPSGMEGCSPTPPTVDPSTTFGWTLPPFPGQPSLAQMHASFCSMTLDSLNAAAGRLRAALLAPQGMWGGQPCMEMEYLVGQAAMATCYFPWVGPWGDPQWNKYQPCCCGCGCGPTCPLDKGGNGRTSPGGSCPTCGNASPMRYYGGPLIPPGAALPHVSRTGTIRLMGVTSGFTQHAPFSWNIMPAPIHQPGGPCSECLTIWDPVEASACFRDCSPSVPPWVQLPPGVHWWAPQPPGTCLVPVYMEDCYGCEEKGEGPGLARICCNRWATKNYSDPQDVECHTQRCWEIAITRPGRPGENPHIPGSGEGQPEIWYDPNRQSGWVSEDGQVVIAPCP